MGGESVKEVVRKLMYRTISNELGQNFSWEGRKGKRPFQKLKLADALIRKLGQENKNYLLSKLLTVLGAVRFRKN